MPVSSNGSSASGWIDTHVHVFRKDANFAADRRYAPDYDATPEALSAAMAANGVAHAVLVQPSFLGTDNSYLLAAIAASPALFSGIAVVPPDMAGSDLAALRARGVAGIRMNCIGRASPDFGGAERALVHRLADLGMVLQLQAEAAHWRLMEPFLSAAPLRIVIDHFGRTAPGDASAGFETLLRAAECNPNLWFKFSGGYRLAGRDADACASALLDRIGPDRIVWGSDWPHTQFEGLASYQDALAALQRWVPDEHLRRKILTSNARLCLR